MLVSLGLDHRQARLSVRERFHLEDGDVPRFYEALAARGVREAVLTRTCNRMEAYCWWPESAGASPRERAREIGCAWVGREGPEVDTLLSTARWRSHDEVAIHLLRVASGLESQILGDIHILGQLRRAFRDAVEAERVGPHLHRLFETAFRVGKQVRRGTRLMTARHGVGSEVARAAAEHWGSLEERRCVVVGCGKSGAHAARCLAERGARDLTVVNRTLPRAEKLAGELASARAEPLDALPRLLRSADVLVVATGAREPVVTRASLEAALPGASGGLLIVDVASPRNVEPSAGELPGVALVDLDTLHPAGAEVERSRAAAVPEAEELVHQGAGEFLSWLELHPARHALGPLREVLSEVCQREVSHLAGESALAQRTIDRIVAGVMAHPMTALRAAPERAQVVESAARAIGRLFPDAGPPSKTSGWASSAG